MWLKKLKKKKLQCFLIGMLLFLSSLIFSSGLSMMTSIKEYVNEYYSNENFYDIAIYNANENSRDDILKWCKNNSEIKDVKDIYEVVSGNNLYHNGENLKVPMYSVVALEDIDKVPFGLNKVTSLNNESWPKDGEIWITQLLADNYNISLGDDLVIKTKEKDISLKVTSLINDSNQPSTTMSETMLYTNKKSADDLSSFTKAPLIFIDVKKGANIFNLEKDLASTVKVGGATVDKDLLNYASTTTSSITGGICTLASILVFIVSVLLIRFIIWSSILKEYKSIGIYKALGFSKGEIVKFYIIGYSLTAFIGSFLGALCSIPVVNFIASKTLKYIGDFNGTSPNFVVIFSTMFIFSLVVIINIFFVIRRTNKISPVEAFRTGITSSKKKLTKSLIKNTTSPLALAINDIIKYKKVSNYITLTITLSLTLVLLFGNLNESILNMKERTNVWFGFPKSDVTISAPTLTSEGAIKDVLNEVKNDSRVKNYVYGSMAFQEVELDTKKYNIKSSLYNRFVVNSYSNELEFSIIDGHNPFNSNEVAVSLKILKEAGLSIGDYIELTINNKKNSYLISGSYNALMSNGYGIRMLNSAIEKEIPEFVGSEIFVNLKDSSEIEGFEKDINSKFSNLDASNIHPLMKYSIESIPGTILPVTYLLMIVFIVFCSITITNIIIMSVRDNRRNFGVMKALGFTSNEIRNRYLFRIIILTSISVVIATILNLAVSRPIIAAAIMNLDVLIISPIIMVTLIISTVILILLITLLSCRAIKNTKPNELMEE
ncbi:MAG: ABC transporter permease [Clostridiaceae bacterium]